MQFSFYKMPHMIPVALNYVYISCSPWSFATLSKFIRQQVRKRQNEFFREITI